VPGDRFIELALGEDRHVLDVLFRDAREAVTVQDRSGSLVYANDRAAEMLGLSSGSDMMSVPAVELVSRFEMIDENGDPLAIDELPGRKVLAGLDAPEVTVGYRRPGSPQVRWSRVNSSPIRNDAGEVVWAINFFLDISEQVRARQAERLLGAVADVLAGSLSLRENLTKLADLLGSEVGDWCEIHLIDDRGDLVSAGMALADSELFKLPWIPTAKSERIHLGSERLQARVAKTGQSEMLVEIEADSLIGEATDRRLSLPMPTIDSVVCVPLGTRTTALGTLSLARLRPAARFDNYDLALIERIGERAGIALANAKLYELEHETAEALRSGLAPASMPTIDGLDLAARYVPLAQLGHIGGDFFDVVVLSERSAAFVVGDVEGKGIPAAAAVGLARDTLRATIKLRPATEVVFSQLNEALNGLERPRMCTIAYLRLDRKGQGFVATVALAGHPPPLLISPDGSHTLLGEPCPPAGVTAILEPKDLSVELEPGDTLVLYTDGYMAAGETPMMTLSRLARGAENEQLETLLDHLLLDLASEIESFRDDVLLLALRVV
jgi:hypothetical protein